MVKHRKHKVLRILLFTFLLLIACVGGFTLWLSSHYKQIIKDRLPEMILKSTDSLYHISFTDVDVSILKGRATITGLKLTVDKTQEAAMRKAKRHIPVTLSTVSIPELEAYGVVWRDLTKGSFDCDHVIVRDLKWRMLCAPNPKDSTLIHDKQKDPKISRVTANRIDFIQPHVTYDYQGPRDTFSCYMDGGTAVLNKFRYNYDITKDTSTFIYSGNGKLRLDSFILLKKAGKYIVKKPLLDFESTDNSVTLKNVKMHHLTDHDPQNGNVKEIYDLSFPGIELVGFNWNKLVNRNQLLASKVNAVAPDIQARFIRENESNDVRMGSYPNQLLLQVGIHTNIHLLNIKEGHLKYTEVTKDKHEGVIEFTNIKGSFSNITNIDSIISTNKNCVIKLEGKFNNKSPVSATFELGLSDNTGRFVMNGNLENLDGDDVIKQVQAFTFVEVTSFHMSRIDMHVEGDEHYGKGSFTMLYNDLKISLFKFKSKYRKGKHGPFSFLGSALVLYPANPMPNKEVRTVTTFFDREPDKGFISLLWRNIYRGAKKTAVRNDGVITLTDGKEDKPGEPPHKKSFLRRLFSKKKK